MSNSNSSSNSNANTNTNKMLIDATHAEETRVVVLRNGRVEEFDFESAARKLLRGNIYLAKVTRVEPSLQAAFVDYGGNRHGFLAFNEIHPDYYQIPVADRQALLDEEAAQEAAEEAEVDAHAERLARRRSVRSVRDAEPASGEHLSGDADEGDIRSIAADDDRHHDHDGSEDSAEAISLRTEPIEEIISEALPPETVGGFDPIHVQSGHAQDDHGHGHDDDRDHISHTGDHDGDERPSDDSDLIQGDTPEGGRSDRAFQEIPLRPRRRPRSYKIQEVIKRRQVILVQVVKEERGNKGAALTTYLSLAGRYTVLMPNTARGGGISRKITQPGDRKRLKAIANELEVPEGMGLIIRTAGAARTSQEIKRDFEYLLRLWESVRELTLESTAPSLVYEEGNLIKRSIRDLYNKDVEEVVVAGEPAFKEAQDFMRMLMPSHAKNVIQYQGSEPLFTRYRMEQQLAAMFSPQVTLKSGGYLVINQTEALVAIDVNSGKSTREYSIEETAHSTNLEASDEIARQLKLRDLAGLVVIDFIDMEEKRNIRNVERRLKDALRFDRARIQLGRISHFGLMEMSRQRLRTGVLEGSTTQCPHCQGTGIIRSIESVALAVIRGLEDALLSGTRMALVATTTPQVALYILNAKRAYITDMEARHGLSITVQGSDKLQGANYTIDKVVSATAEPALRRRSASAVNMEWGFDGEGDEPADLQGYQSNVTDIDGGSDDDQDGPVRASSGSLQDGEGEERGGRRRRRGRRGRRDEGSAGDGRTSEGREPRTPNGNGPRGSDDGYRASHSTEVSHDERGPDDNVPDDIGGEGDAGEERVGGPPRAARGEGEGLDAEGRSKRGRRRGRRGGRRGGRDRDRPLGVGGDANASGPDAGIEGAGADGGDSDHGTVEHGHDSGRDVEARSSHVSPAQVREPEAPREPRGRRSRHGDSSVDAALSSSRPDTDVVVSPAAAAIEPVKHLATVHPTVGHQSVVPAAASPVVVTPFPADATVAAEPKPRRVASTSSEPVLERMVVRSDATIGAASAPNDAADAGDSAAAKPTRKGWWQRKLGLE
jgi:ribonuclease E